MKAVEVQREKNNSLNSWSEHRLKLVDQCCKNAKTVNFCYQPGSKTGFSTFEPKAQPANNRNTNCNITQLNVARLN